MSQEPIIVLAGSNDYSAICDECVHAKNRPGKTGDAWSADEDLTDVTVSGTLDPGTDEQWVECHRGHQHLVLRQGTQRARNFGHS